GGRPAPAALDLAGVALPACSRSRIRMSCRGTMRYRRTMRTLHARLVMLAAVLFVALAVSQAASPALTVVAIAAVLLLAATVVPVATAKTLTVGARARAHKEALAEMAEPRHPSTAGLPLTRAPSRVVFAA